MLSNTLKVVTEIICKVFKITSYNEHYTLKFINWKEMLTSIFFLLFWSEQNIINLQIDFGHNFSSFFEVHIIVKFIEFAINKIIKV